MRKTAGYSHLDPYHLVLSEGQFTPRREVTRHDAPFVIVIQNTFSTQKNTNFIG